MSLREPIQAVRLNVMMDSNETAEERLQEGLVDLEFAAFPQEEESLLTF